MVAECRSTTMLEGEHLGDVLIERLRAGASDPELVLRAVLNAMAIDGRLAPPGEALRSLCARIQAALEP